MFKRKSFLSDTQKQQIVDAIQAAELETSGEIRVHLEPHCKGDPLMRGLAVFRQLDMHKTAEQNGVLIYLAYEDRKFAILGDQGINRNVPADFWNDIKMKMAAMFQEGKLAEGLCYAIAESGHQLKTYFPYTAGDKNELSNDISENK